MCTRRYSTRTVEDDAINDAAFFAKARRGHKFTITEIVGHSRKQYLLTETEREREKKRGSRDRQIENRETEKQRNREIVSACRHRLRERLSHRFAGVLPIVCSVLVAMVLFSLGRNMSLLTDHFVQRFCSRQQFWSRKRSRSRSRVPKQGPCVLASLMRTMPAEFS